MVTSSVTATMLGKIRNKPLSDEFYDESSGYEDETGVKIAANLSAEDRRRAAILYHLFNELWGVCIVVGDPGTGKDLFGNYLSYTIKRYFPWKRILRDERPRRLFGNYAGLFNEEVLQSDLSNMRAIAKGKSATQIDAAMETFADDWVKGAGEVMLKNSLLYLTEFWRYCYNREPHNPMNKTMGAIHKVKRHLDCLILGTVQLPTELDKKTCLPWVDWKVICTHSAINKTGFTYFVQKVHYDARTEILVNIGKPFPISIDAGKPKTYLGDGKICLRKPNYIPQTEEEQIVLEVIKAGLDKYEDIVEYIQDNGDMTETEILDTMKELKFRKAKRVLEFPCFFGLYNSKSAPSIQSGVKVGE